MLVKSITTDGLIGRIGHSFIDFQKGCPKQSARQTYNSSRIVQRVGQFYRVPHRPVLFLSISISFTLGEGARHRAVPSHFPIAIIPSKNTTSSLLLYIMRRSLSQKERTADGLGSLIPRKLNCDHVRRVRTTRARCGTW